MRNYILELPKYRLNLSLKLVRRRKPLVPEPFIPTAKIVKKKFRTGTLVARFARHIFGHRNVGKAFGAAMSILVIFSTYFPPSQSALAQGSTEDTIIQSDETVLHTEKGTQYPTNPVKITQGFSFFHPAIDLDGLTGDTIKPVKKGRVVITSYSKYAYGNSIIIDHGNNLISLYAHLSKINVEKDQEVTTDTIIGEMGASGRAFGDHLHLEIIQNGRNLNPVTVLPR